MRRLLLATALVSFVGITPAQYARADIPVVNLH